MLQFLFLFFFTTQTTYRFQKLLNTNYSKLQQQEEILNTYFYNFAIFTFATNIFHLFDRHTPAETTVITTILLIFKLASHKIGILDTVIIMAMSNTNIGNNVVNLSYDKGIKVLYILSIFFRYRKIVVSTTHRDYDKFFEINQSNDEFRPQLIVVDYFRGFLFLKKLSSN